MSEDKIATLMELIDEGYSPEMLNIYERLEKDGFTLSFSRRTARLFLRKGDKAIPVPKGFEWFALSYYGLKRSAERVKTTVFIAYSHKDLWFAHSVWKLLYKAGIPCYLAELYPEPGASLWEKIKRMIDSSDILLVIYTHNAMYSAYVNQEIGYAHARGKYIIPVVEKGVELKGSLAGLEYIELDYSNPANTLASIANVIKELLEKRGNGAETLAFLITFLMLLGVISLIAGSLIASSETSRENKEKG